jgi:hypothetical protein
MPLNQRSEQTMCAGQVTQQRQAQIAGTLHACYAANTPADVAGKTLDN